MSLLSSFVKNQLIPSLESSLESHAPEIQEAMLKELKLFIEHFGEWLKDKLEKASILPK